MKTQTAIDWLIEELTDNGIDHLDLAKEIIDQAKAMEKEQMENAFEAGLFDGTMDDVNDRIHKQYYNETYGK